MIPDSGYVAATLGAVDVKITHSTQGIAVEIDAKRPREADESPGEAATNSVLWALYAYDQAVKELAERGLTAGPFKKAAP